MTEAQVRTKGDWPKTMFSFDAAALPQLTTRKALIAVDFQNDFVGARHGAALPVLEPEGFVNRAVALSEAFRDGVGDVVWVQSCFDQARPADQEPIITSDTEPRPLRPSASTGAGSSRRRGKLQEPPSLAEGQGPPDPEAFLSHEEPACVRPSSTGAEMAPAVKTAVRKGDTVLTKSHYSAFLGTPLLRLLRAKMVMEVFICGSLANIGVYATALDAAGHGMTITVVEDCCGYRVEPRQRKAVRSLIKLTGCEFASCQEVLEVIQPMKKQLAAPSRDTAESRKTKELQEGKEDRTEKKGEGSRPREAGEVKPRASATNSSEIVKSMMGLRLEEGVGSTEHADQPDTTPPRPGSDTAKASTTRPDTHHNDVDDEGDDADDDGEPRDASAAALVGSYPTPPGDQAKRALQPLSQPPKNKTAFPSKDAVPARRQTEAAEAKVAASSDTDGEEQRNQPRTTTGLCEGDTSIITNLLLSSVEAGIFDRLRNEVQWQRMSHQGGEVPRLVAVQGAVSLHDGSAPVYRHPSDEAPPLRPFSPTVLAVKAAVEEQLGHPVNHVLVQFYRDGSDCISEHSDKTLDVVRDSYIANASFGAERTMAFRTKRPARIPPSSPRASGDSDGLSSPAAAGPSQRRVQRAVLPHNSLCKMGLATNMKWLHAIRPDRRADRDKTAAEMAYGGARLSLTFRRIATFLDRDHTIIWGQGATSKTLDGARPVVNGQGPEAVAMLRAFGAENHASDFDWDAHYGEGFDVLHIRTAPRFFASAEDAVVNTRVALMLAEYGIGYARGSMGAAQSTEFAAAHGDAADEPSSESVKFVDNDAARTVVQGDVAIMLYLDSCYGQAKAAPAPSHAELAARFTRFQRALHLRDMMRAPAPAPQPGLSRSLRRELAAWDAFAAEARDGGAGFIAGPCMCLADFALWPVLHALVEERGSAAVFGGGLHRLRAYYDALAARESTRRVMGANPVAGTLGP